MSYNETVMKDLQRIIPQKGKVEWIGIQSKKKEKLSVVESVKVEKGTGLAGDHFKGSSSRKTQVTLSQQEHLKVISSILGKKGIDPQLTLRKIVVSGINLLSLKHQQFRIGDVILETTGICAPCSRMWSSPQKVVHLLVWEINPIRNMKGGLKWLRKDTNPKKS